MAIGLTPRKLLGLDVMSFYLYIISISHHSKLSYERHLKFCGRPPLIGFIVLDIIRETDGAIYIEAMVLLLYEEGYVLRKCREREMRLMC